MLFNIVLSMAIPFDHSDVEYECGDFINYGQHTIAILEMRY